ncbi:bacteriophage protein [Clostridia bacterium]|nr:bacteriophage protein [Clostridia bacterium]
MIRKKVKRYKKCSGCQNLQGSTMSYNIVYYENENGKSQIRDFLDSLSPGIRAKLARNMMLLEANGYDLGFPAIRPMGNDLFELWASGDNKIARVLYFFFDKSDIILTNSFIKKTQATPPVELKRAESFRTDYKRRH